MEDVREINEDVNNTGVKAHALKLDSYRKKTGKPGNLK